MPFIFERQKMNLGPKPAQQRASTATKPARRPSTTISTMPTARVPPSSARPATTKKNLFLEHEPKKPNQVPLPPKPATSRLATATVVNAHSRSGMAIIPTKRDAAPLQPIQTNQRITTIPQRPAQPLPKPTTQPTNSQVEIDNSAVTILALVPFGPQPVVDFGQVCVGDTQLRKVGLRNLLDTEQQLVVRNFPKPEKQIEIDSLHFTIHPKSQKYANISWSPKIVGSIRETITFHDANKMPKRIVIVGAAVRSKPEPAQRATRAIAAKFTGQTPNRLAIRMGLHRSASKDRLRRGLEPKGPAQRLLVYASRRRLSGQIVNKIKSKFNDSRATTVQSYWRMVLAKRQLLRLKESHSAAVKIQSYFRMILARRQLEQARKRLMSIVMLQASVRGFLERKRCSVRRQAIVKIQSLLRRLIAIRQLEALRKQHQAAIKIQAYFRMLAARSQMRKFKQQHRSATIIQAQWRALSLRTKFINLRQAALAVQCSFRQILAKRQLKVLIKRNQAATKIQAHWRKIMAKNQLDQLKCRNKAAITIQAKWRAFICQRQYLALIDLVVCLQSYSRQALARSQLRAWKARRDATICIQSFWRMVLAKRQVKVLQKRSRASVVIQAHWKGWQDRRKFTKTRRAAVALQSLWRARVARKELARLRALDAATRFIQSQCRAFLFRGRLRRSMNALVSIQSRQAQARSQRQQQHQQQQHQATSLRLQQSTIISL